MTNFTKLKKFSALEINLQKYFLQINSKKILHYGYLFFCAYAFSVASHASNRECVILLHGLARSHTCMSKLEHYLKKHDYIVVNQDYPSTTQTIDELANATIPSVVNECLQYHPKNIYFVTHSLGGIILQTYLQNHKINKLKHIVMLSPPNHGSPVANLLHHNWIYRYVTGPAGQELTTYKMNPFMQLNLHRKRNRIGIIAGCYNFVPFGNYIFNEANDGAVSVSSAKMNRMNDFIVFPVSHSFIMDNTSVEKQILYFLQHGQFKHCFKINNSTQLRCCSGLIK